MQIQSKYAKQTFSAPIIVGGLCIPIKINNTHIKVHISSLSTATQLHFFLNLLVSTTINMTEATANKGIWDYWAQ